LALKTATMGQKRSSNPRSYFTISISPVALMQQKLRRGSSDRLAAERVVAFYNQCSTAEQWIKEGKDAIKMDAAVMPQQSRNVSTPRRNRSAGSTAFHGPSGRSYLAEDARRGNHDLATAVEIWAVEIRAWHPGSVGQDHPAQALAHLVRHATSLALAGVRGTVSLGAGMATLPMNSIEL
jgi:hypothetical protein